MKHLVKQLMAGNGLHGYTDASLPAGVNWLHDIERSGLMPRHPLCLDVGANIGQTVRELRDRWPTATIHAFEPFAQPFARLSALCKDWPGVTTVPLALGSQAGELAVPAQAQSVLNSLRHAAPQGGLDEAGSGPLERIRVTTLDAYAEQQRLGRIDVLKTDTEGHDLEVLRGALGALQAHRVVFVFTEVTFHTDNVQNTPFVPVMELLTPLGYRFCGLYDTWPLHHFEEPNLFCNALFVSREHWRPPA